MKHLAVINFRGPGLAQILHELPYQFGPFLIWT